MNRYIAFYAGRQIAISAVSLYAANVQAVAKLNVPRNKEHMVMVVLCEKDTVQVTHSTSLL